MTQEELKQALELHGKWLNDEEGGKRFDLSYANLSYADLSYANLNYADLSGADLSYANLSGADLNGANLSGADLNYADLSYADLNGANTINTRGLDVICVQLNTSNQT